MEPTGILETPLGNVTYVMTQADHVFLRTESTNDDSITVNRVHYHVCFHVNLVDGKWVALNWNEPYLSRKGNYAEATLAARKTTREVLTKAWTEYLAAHPELTGYAALAHAKKELDKLEEEADELKKSLCAKLVEVRAARRVYQEIANRK